MIQEKSTLHQEETPYYDVHRHNHTHLYPKLNCYVDNDAKKCAVLSTELF